MTSTRRHLGQPALQGDDQRHPADPTDGRGGHRLPVDQALDEAGDLAEEPVGVDREPEQLRQLADQDGQRQPVHVADHRRPGQQVGDEAQPGHAGDDRDRGDHQGASTDASATARSGSPPDTTSGRIVAAIIGPSDESGPRTRIRDGPNSA